MNLSARDMDLICRVVDADDGSLRDLCLAGELDPASSFVGADLEHADLRDEDLRGFVFDEAHLSGAKFNRCNLDSVSFVDSSMKGVDLRGASIEGADFSSADLAGIKIDSDQVHILSKFEGSPLETAEEPVRQKPTAWLPGARTHRNAVGRSRERARVSRTRSATPSRPVWARNHVGRVLASVLGPHFSDEDFMSLGPELFENVYSFLKTNGHSEPRSTATEIISDVAWKMSKMVVRGEEITLPKGWLFTCCRRRAIDELRKGDLLEPVETEVLDQIFTGQQVFSAQFVDYSRAKLYIQAALVELPPKQRALVWLDQIECLRKEEIMKRLDIEGDNHYRSLKSKALRALYREVSALADPMTFERRLRELAKKKSDKDE